MSVMGIALYSRDAATTAAFYERHLGASQSARADGSVRLRLDGGGLIELRPIGGVDADPAPCDDGRNGYWHAGVLVGDFDATVKSLRGEGVEWFIEPVFNQVAQVWCGFFHDPDGHVVELVGGQQQYSQVFDGEAAARRARARPGEAALFEHVAFTTPDWARTRRTWTRAGYTVVGSLDLSDGDPRGMVLYYLTGADGLTVEVFTYTAPTARALDPAPRQGFAGLLATAGTRARLEVDRIADFAPNRGRYVDQAGLTVIDAE
ncbi:MAG: VOC family protein [Bifidobacteriaceae bacterium]|jgi:catechol 2,3-dioxygenase-like lactoylglutathione lyase family enzyme|nr:VOC family protein [Bifidobacteriaceae bacterium]